jgi:hypothetical protein
MRSSAALTRSAFARGALLRRPLASIARRRIGFELGAQPLDPRLGRRCQLAQPLAPAERTGASGRAHPEPVLRQHVERHQTLSDQRRHPAGQQLIEHRGVRHAKIRQCVVIHRHPAAQPTIGEMLLAHPGQLPRAADPVHRRPQPQRHHQLGCRRRLSRYPLARFHRIV